MTPITIIIPSCNENPITLKETVEGILKGISKDKISVIVVDDFSDIPVKLNNVTVIRNSRRMGSATSRDIGILASSSNFIVTTDSHIKFKTRWVEKIIDTLSRNPKQTLCFTCIPTGESDFKGRMYGGNIDIMVKPWGLSGVLSPKWNTSCPQNGKVQCVMGGAYAFTTEWYRRITPYSGIKGWCPTELVSLSLRTWLAGGECIVDPTIEVEHYFRSKAPFESDPVISAYNKIRLGMAVLPLEVATMIPTALGMVPSIDKAIKMFSNIFRDSFKDRNKMESLVEGDFKTALLKGGINLEVSM